MKCCIKSCFYSRMCTYDRPTDIGVSHHERDPYVKETPIIHAMMGVWFSYMAGYQCCTSSFLVLTASADRTSTR
jgi:hypothetical protein